MSKIAKLAMFQIALEQAKIHGVKEVPIEAALKLCEMAAINTIAREVLEEISLEQTGWTKQRLELEEIRKIDERDKDLNSVMSKQMEEAFELFKSVAKRA